MQRQPASTNDEACDTPHAAGPKDQTQQADFDCSEGRRKAFDTLAAAFALTGFQLHRLDDGRLLVARWGLARELADSSEAARFLRQIGGSHA